jgi:hypothetical protein
MNASSTGLSLERLADLLRLVLGPTGVALWRILNIRKVLPACVRTSQSKQGDRYPGRVPIRRTLSQYKRTQDHMAHPIHEPNSRRPEPTVSDSVACACACAPPGVGPVEGCACPCQVTRTEASHVLSAQPLRHQLSDVFHLLQAAPTHLDLCASTATSARRQPARHARAGSFLRRGRVSGFATRERIGMDRVGEQARHAP